MYPSFSLTGQNLALIRGDRLLFKDCNFQVKSGQVLHLKGPNGAGKTSLLNLICGLIEPDQGQVTGEFEDVDSLSSWLSLKTLYLGHQLGIKSTLSVYENLAFYAALRGCDRQQIPQAISAVGLQGYETQLAAHLSQGQRRRICLARLLIENVPLWILDEPFVALDVKGQAWLAGLIEQQVERNGAVIFTSHQPVSLSIPTLELSVGV